MESQDTFQDVALDVEEEEPDWDPVTLYIESLPYNTNKQFRRTIQLDRKVDFGQYEDEKAPEYYEEKIDPEKLVVAAAQPPVPDFPDGGLRAYSVAVGASLLSFSTFGWINAFGVFQTYYQTKMFTDLSPDTIAWIGSVQYGMVLLPSALVGGMIDRGHYRLPLAISSIGYIISLFLTAECKTFWEVILGQGVATGLFAGMLFGGAPPVVSHWFRKKRALALGILAMGSSIGGTILPIITNTLLPKVGYSWTMRIMAFILSTTVIAANLLVRTRLPPSKVKKSLLTFSAFKRLDFATCVIGYNVTFLGLYVPLTYMTLAASPPSEGGNGGLSDTLAFYLIPLANGASLVGRLSSGVLADKFGTLNVLIPFTVVGGVMCFAWPFATHSIAGSVIVALIYGCATGALVSMLPGAPARMGPPETMGGRIGMAISCSAFGIAFSLPIGGAILSSSNNSFEDVGYYAGAMVLAGCLLLGLSRRIGLGQWSGKY
ncbi:MFS general substrate transporter [Coniophora puteana RWD-64-598 SS2]|uniref:MFS general substrate transporter n=1 Tax=Coniophora puteana (strain RWD-64-598) TaxID=741705 RepID=A0A5M3MAT0_CONPW|nr:MFS general substrate transporter [Coniophora puteana RWD-64-598 SS2]EIW76329.1 MFS general substrate transporter [Coniophora puteana RWD-64-598 SS2]